MNEIGVYIPAVYHMYKEKPGSDIWGRFHASCLAKNENRLICICCAIYTAELQRWNARGNSITATAGWRVQGPEVYLSNPILTPSPTLTVTPPSFGIAVSFSMREPTLTPWMAPVSARGKSSIRFLSPPRRAMPTKTTLMPNQSEQGKQSSKCWRRLGQRDMRRSQPFPGRKAHNNFVLIFFLIYLSCFFVVIRCEPSASGQKAHVDFFFQNEWREFKLLPPRDEVHPRGRTHLIALSRGEGGGAFLEICFNVAMKPQPASLRARDKFGSSFVLVFFSNFCCPTAVILNSSISTITQFDLVMFHSLYIESPFFFIQCSPCLSLGGWKKLFQEAWMSITAKKSEHIINTNTRIKSFFLSKPASRVSGEGGGVQSDSFLQHFCFSVLCAVKHHYYLCSAVIVSQASSPKKGQNPF